MTLIKSRRSKSSANDLNSRIEVPVLENAKYLNICSFGNNCGVGVDEGPSRSNIDPLDITLPALESVRKLFIGGKTARCVPVP